MAIGGAQAVQTNFHPTSMLTKSPPSVSQKHSNREAKNTETLKTIQIPSPMHTQPCWKEIHCSENKKERDVCFCIQNTTAVWFSCDLGLIHNIKRVNHLCETVATPLDITMILKHIFFSVFVNYMSTSITANTYAKIINIFMGSQTYGIGNNWQKQQTALTSEEHVGAWHKRNKSW